jgi:hypothetical protein
MDWNLQASGRDRIGLTDSSIRTGVGAAPAHVGSDGYFTASGNRLQRGARASWAAARPLSFPRFAFARARVRASRANGWRRGSAAAVSGCERRGDDGAAPESNRPSRGLHDRTGFEDQLGHRARAAPGERLVGSGGVSAADLSGPQPARLVRAVAKPRPKESSHERQPMRARGARETRARANAKRGKSRPWAARPHWF